MKAATSTGATSRQLSRWAVSRLLFATGGDNNTALALEL